MNKFWTLILNCFFLIKMSNLQPRHILYSTKKKRVVFRVYLAWLNSVLMIARDSRRPQGDKIDRPYEEHSEGTSKVSKWALRIDEPGRETDRETKKRSSNIYEYAKVNSFGSCNLLASRDWFATATFFISYF